MNDITPNMKVIVPEWPAPAGVKALVTTRQGGVSEGIYGSFNLAHHVGDTPSAVAENRALLQCLIQTPVDASVQTPVDASVQAPIDASIQAPVDATINTPNTPMAPCWLNQVHGTTVVNADAQRQDDEIPKADASVTTVAGLPCVVMTADCLPVLLCAKDGRQVAAAHAGWRGLAAGVLESCIAAMRAHAQSTVHAPDAELLAWLGPAISAAHFEVGEEVRHAFVQQDERAELAFSPNPQRPGHWFADLYQLARQRLQACGVEGVYGGGFCTYSDTTRFYSYRRDGVTGRMASLIWRVE